LGLAKGDTTSTGRPSIFLFHEFSFTSRNFPMCHFLLRSGRLAGVLALVSAVTLTACGGGKDPILGLGTGPALVPSVSATAPLARQPAVTGVATNTQLAATFNKAMNPATLDAGTFLLACPLASPVAGTVSYDANSRVVSFAPLALLPASTLCVATVTTGAQDDLGVPLASDFVWSFETAASADTQAPLVTGFVPLLEAVAPTNAQITVSFNEDMAPLSLNNSSLTLKTTVGNAPVAGKVSYAVGARTATFTPINPALLPGNTAFTATVSTLATDLAGNPLAANTVWTFTTSDALDSTPPVVSLTLPAQGHAGICVNPHITASFSEAMDPLSLSTSTMTLAPSSAPGAPVALVFTYDPQTYTVSMNPGVDLSPMTAYTATVRSGNLGVKDLAGNGLASDKVWSFTTGNTTCQTPVVLGASSGFAILASAAVTNIPTSNIVGNVGLTPDTGANITGFSAPLTCPEVVGQIYAVDGTGPACALPDVVLLSQAKTDALAAFAHASHAVRGTPVSVTTNLAGLTFYPGLYASLTSLDLSAGGILTLDAQGDPNAVFLLRSATSITTLSTSQIVLSGGAKASQVFWTAGSAITLGVDSVMKGTLLAGTAVTLQTGATLEGRALNQGPAAAAITCDACTITLPTP
jgi:hypothetical protein